MTLFKILLSLLRLSYPCRNIFEGLLIIEEEPNWGGNDTRPRNVRDVIKVCVGEGAGLAGESFQAATTCRGTLVVSVCFTGADEEEPGGA